MLTFLKADISLHHCDALLFTCVEDFPLRVRGSFGRAQTFRAVLEARDYWEPGRIYPQLPEAGQKNIIVHANLGADPENVRALVTVVNNIKALADKLQNTYDTEYVKALGEYDFKAERGELGMADVKPVRKRFRSIAMPRIGEHTGYGWPETKEILKIAHSEANPPLDQLENTFHVEVYEVDEEGVAPKR